MLAVKNQAGIWDADAEREAGRADSRRAGSRGRDAGAWHGETSQKVGAGRGRGNSGQQRESWEVSVYEETAEWRCVPGRGKRGSRSRAAPDSVSGRRAADETGVVVRGSCSPVRQARRGSAAGGGSAGKVVRRRHVVARRSPTRRRSAGVSHPGRTRGDQADVVCLSCRIPPERKGRLRVRRKRRSAVILPDGPGPAARQEESSLRTRPGRGLFHGYASDDTSGSVRMQSFRGGEEDMTGDGHQRTYLLVFYYLIDFIF